MSAKPRLTIGMACYDDFDGVWLTVQSLRLYHPEVLKSVELVVVDNHPNRVPPSKGGPESDRLHSHELQQVMGWWYGSTAEAVERAGEFADANLGGFQYLPNEEAVGTAAPRDLLFREAKGDFVVCLDSHVMLAPGSLDALLAYNEANPNHKDIVSGPMVYDGLRTYSTHFDPVWRGQMWGTWGNAWACRCGRTLLCREAGVEKGRHTAWADPYPHENDTPGRHGRCPGCGQALPAVSWHGHESVLRKMGFVHVAERPGAEPFETWAQGLGLFGCYRKAWPGFNPRFRGFGGEEGYVHEKIRRAGGKSVCIPRLKWLHRFGRPGGAKYPHSVWNRMRNYVLGHAELGLDFAPVKAAFVGVLPPDELESEWAQLTDYPSNPPASPVPLKKQGCGVPAPQGGATIEEWFERLKGQQHDFAGHEEMIKALAGHAAVVELGGRRGSSTVCLLAGRPASRAVVDPNRGGEWEALERARGDTTLTHVPSRSEDVALASECCLLFIDTTHTGEQLAKELGLYRDKATRIALHDTVLHMHQGEQGKPGFYPALKAFLKDNPEWFVMEHDGKNYGLTVFSRDPKDRPAEPVLLWPPDEGPGAELKEMIAALGGQSSANCDCNSKAIQMNIWGVKGCREHRDEIIGWIKDGQEKWGWKASIAAGWKAILTGLVFRTGVADPVAGLVDEAIRRAEEKESKK